MKSWLAKMIQKAIDDCYAYGEGYGVSSDGIVKVCAEWVDSNRPGYSLMHITILENGVVKFSYNDFGTECEI